MTTTNSNDKVKRQKNLRKTTILQGIPPKRGEAEAGRYVDEMI